MRLFRLLALSLIAVVALPGAALLPVPRPADDRVAAVQVVVTPNDSDWTYALGETVRFRVTVRADQHPVPGATITYTLGTETAPGQPQTATIPSHGVLEIDGGARQTPGFIRCIVTTEVGGRTYRGLATAGFAPDQIQPTQENPDDFDAFWQAQKEQLARVPLEPEIRHLPEASTSDVNVYAVSVRSVGGWKGAPVQPRIYGILCEPTAEGVYPALLRVPGAGVRPYRGLVDLAARGAITLEIGIHGIPVNLDQTVYDQLRVGALDGYWTFHVGDRERYYYRRVILGALRANDFLVTRSKWDGKHLAVGGESQGGMLAIATAALDPRVTALHAIVPAMCDLSGPLEDRPGGWPHVFDDASQRTDDAIRTLRYYDTVNFARRVKVPGIYAWGYNDEVCPPTSMFAAYQAISAPKQLVVALQMGHRTLQEVYDATNDWILAQAQR